MMRTILAALVAAAGEDEPRDVVDECHAGPCPTPPQTRTPPLPLTPSPTIDVAPTPQTTAAAPSPTSAAASGTLRGYVHIGPTCPVVREGEDCDDRPYEAELDVLDEDAAVIVTVRSDTNGVFSATLAPGTYRLVPATDGRLPTATEQTFAVEAGRVTEVDVAYDSGIR